MSSLGSRVNQWDKEQKQSQHHFSRVSCGPPGTPSPRDTRGTSPLFHPSRTPAAPRLFTADKDAAHEQPSAAHLPSALGVPHPHPFPSGMWVPSSLLFLPPSKSPITDPSVRPDSPPGGVTPWSIPKSSHFSPNCWVLVHPHPAPEGLGQPRGHHCPCGLPSATQGDVYSQSALATQSNHLCVRRGLGRSGRCTSPLPSAGALQPFKLKSLGKQAGLGSRVTSGCGNTRGNTELSQGTAGPCSGCFGQPNPTAGSARASVSPTLWSPSTHGGQGRWTLPGRS